VLADEVGLEKIREKFSTATLDVQSFLKKYRVCTDFGNCYCCSIGCYLQSNESDYLKQLVEQKQSALKELGLRDGQFPIIQGYYHKNKQQTANLPFSYLEADGTVLEGVRHSSCVFRDVTDGFCSLQKMAMSEGKPAWYYKPLECWLFPIILDEDANTITIADRTSELWANEEFPDFLQYTNCSQPDESGVVGYDKFAKELTTLSEILGRDLLAEIKAYRNTLEEEAIVGKFIDKHYKHFNAGSLKRAAVSYKRFVEQEGGKVLVSLAGAMSTAELGISLAEMIRQDKVAAVCCTGANLEEDLFNAVAHNEYRLIADYRDLCPEDESQLLAQKYNRVTDTCIPEEEAMRKVESFIIPLWEKAAKEGKSYFPHEYVYAMVRDEKFRKQFQISEQDSWLVAAAAKDIPIYVPGWEDSTLGNMLVALNIMESLSLAIVKTGLHYMRHLIDWYTTESKNHKIGFFQIGGGIAGDFPICVVPLINQDIKGNVPCWSYFCQITDAQESYGGYSGALPNEKITWGKLLTNSERFVINSDATIVAPLIFSYVLGH
jgi:deoxyhypusine synthase